jgi:3-demethoxyubiquinol 3-hydroxylase
MNAADSALRTLGGAAVARRPMPRPPSSTASPRAGAGSLGVPTVSMSTADRSLAGALMRVNHVGEVCAQALYQAQALTARTPAQREQMLAASREEVDHLAWTEERLQALGARPSLLNPLWFGGAFAIGFAAGIAGDRPSLGFVVETERQVEQHLAAHLDRLPAADVDSRVVVDQMRKDEAAHAAAAEAAGALPIPAPLRLLMRMAAKVMTSTAHRI